MIEHYRIMRESAQRIYVELTGEIGPTFIREIETLLAGSEAPVCLLLRNTQYDVAGPETVNRLYRLAQNPRLRTAAFDLTSAQTLLVEWQALQAGIRTFRVFGTEQEARAYLAEMCGE